VRPPPRLCEPPLNGKYGWLILALFGLLLRGYHYLRNPSVWHDEAALILNVLGKNFAELLGPLFFHEASPPLFLWIEKGLTLLLGDGTFALRLVPLLASCASLLLFAWIAHRTLEPRAVPWAILLFACSDMLLWHTCEAKPYAVEVCGATLLLAVYLRVRFWPLARQFLLYGLLSPVLIFLCYPGCFLCGGLLVALFPAVWRSQQQQGQKKTDTSSFDYRSWLGYAALALVIVGSFLALLMGPIHAQRCEEMDGCWQDCFPRWERPWTVPIWLVASTLEMFRYCCRPTGTVLFVLALIGGWRLWRGRERRWLALLTVPIALAVLASFLKAYPYGGVRVVVYAAPAIILLIAAGVPPTFAWLVSRQRGLALLVWLALLAPLVLSIYHLAAPWGRADCCGAAEYILTHRQPGEEVAGNHWEYQYYFRALGSAYIPVERLSSPKDRLWLVLSGVTPEERLRIAQMIPPGDWRTARQRDFERTTVFLLTR
jgi:hypothetical protein